MASPPSTAAPDTAEAQSVKKVRFLDTWKGTVLFIAAILLLRWQVFEPFKIPSGSMEPTLIGHEDYGDRIVTNKLAYRFGGDPKRFDIAVFVYDAAWEGGSPDEKNYIKRLVGLPGDTLVISGGDLFLKDPESGKETILRKWEAAAELQENLWQPVSRATFKQKPLPAAGTGAGVGDAEARTLTEQDNRRACPWNYDPARAKLDGKSLVVEGETELAYAHPVRNCYVKMGRWPFRHVNCPRAHLPELSGPSGAKVGDPREKSEYIRPYLPNSWEGVRCPNCGQLRFPLGNKDDHAEPDIVPDPSWGKVSRPEAEAEAGGEKAKKPPVQDYGEASGSFGTPYFYGGSEVVGDLKLDLELEPLATGGAVELEVGSDLHRAAWIVSLGGEPPAPPRAKGRHECVEKATLSAGAKHILSLAYVDGTVMASLDGQACAPQAVPDLDPVGAAAMRSVARVRFLAGANVRVTRLDLYRDLFYTLVLDNRPVIAQRFRDNRLLLEKEGRYEFRIPKFNPNKASDPANQDYYLMLGDNSPSSKDGRIWGFVPRDHLVGHASFTWWPPSRCRILK